MVIIDTLFDVLSASAGAIFGATFTYFLNHRKNMSMSNQIVVGRQALEKIKLENQELLKRIQEKENLILQMQVQLLGKKQKNTRKK